MRPLQCNHGGHQTHLQFFRQCIPSTNANAWGFLEQPTRNRHTASQGASQPDNKHADTQNLMQTNKQTNKQASNPANIDTIKVLGNHKPTCMRTEVRKQDARTRRGRERERERARERCMQHLRGSGQEQTMSEIDRGNTGVRSLKYTTT